MSNKQKTGFWFLMIPGILILLMLVFGQMMAVIDYDFTVSIGMQEPVNICGEFGVAMNKAFGVSDTIIYLPLLFFGLIGLWLKKAWGLFTMIGALAITAYWPVMHIFYVLYAEGLPGFNFTEFTSYIMILIIITLYALWGMHFLYKNQKLLLE